MNRSAECVFAMIIGICLVAVPASAQLQIEGLGGVTDAAARAPFYAGSIGIGVSFIEIDAEVGRFHDVLPKGVLDALHQLEAEHGLPVQAIARVPATYAMGDIRLIVPHGPIRPFLSGGVGVARLEPQIDVEVQGISLGDVFGLTSFGTQTKTMAMASAGVRFVAGPLELEGGYRYIAIFSKYEPVSDLGNGNILTSVNAVYGAAGLRF